MNNVSKNTIAMAFFVAAFIAPTAFSSFVFADTISVTTQNATNVGEASAVLNGFVLNPNSRSRMYFEWGGGGFPGENITGSQVSDRSASFYVSIAGLLPGRTYYFRAVAISQTTGEKATGSTLDFTTPQRQYLSQQTPTIETRSASSVTSASAVLVGAVNPQGSADTVRWFEWGPTRSLGKQTPKANQGTSADDFSYSISDLQPNTIYYYKAVAQNANGVVTGSLFSFQTGGPNYLPTTPTTGGTPLAITQIPSGISRTGATLNGLALPGGTVVTRGWFEWGTTTDLGNTTAAQNIGSATSIPFSQTITTLSSGTSYYYRAVIENERGKGQGNIIRLVTDAYVVVTPPVTIVEEPKAPSKPIATTTKAATNTATVGIFNGCFPNSLAGWLLLVLIIILIVIAVDHLVDRYQKRKEEKKRHELNLNKEGGGSEGGPRVIK